MAHDLPFRLTHVLAQPTCTVCGYHPGRPSITGRKPPTMQLGDHFPYGWLAERVNYSGSGFPHQVDVPGSHGDGAWRSRDVEPRLYDKTTISVYRARGRRSTQTASGCSVVFGSWRAGVDREIQSGSSSSETGAARSLHHVDLLVPRSSVAIRTALYDMQCTPVGPTAKSLVIGRDLSFIPGFVGNCCLRARS